MDEISIVQDGSSVEVISEKGVIHLQSSADPGDIAHTSDFAVWLYLPVAMKSGEDILIDGLGTNKTVENAKELSYIWESWLPGHFSNISVEFKKTVGPEQDDNISNNRNLILFSGGVDSGYSVSQRAKAGYNQDLLTVHGMDYRINDEKKFSELLNKTSDFSSRFANNRITLKSNATDLYNKVGVNPSDHHISHIFHLSGALFAHSTYKNYYIASDYKFYEQFITHPWGSNSITNKLFSDGYRNLQTLHDDIIRSRKVGELMQRDLMSSLSFCDEYESRPNNCGACSKCVRTIAMAIAENGDYPNMFENSTFPKNWYEVMNPKKPSNRAFLTQIIRRARENQTEKQLPHFDNAVEVLNNITHIKTGQSNTSLVSRIHQRIPHPADQYVKQIYKTLFS